MFKTAPLIPGLALLLLNAAPQPGRTEMLYLCPDSSTAPGTMQTLSSVYSGGQQIHLLISESSAAADAGCTGRELPVAAENILWAAPVDPGDALPRRVSLQGTFSPRVAISEVIWHPADEATRQDEAVSIPVRRAAPAAINRSAWFWSAALWRDTPEDIWSVTAREGITAIYVTVPVTTGGEVQNTEALADFIRDSGQRGLQIWAVVGDPHDVLPASLPALMNRVQAYARYNSGRNADTAIAGLQLDIEPYLLPGFSLDQEYWRERYIATIRQVHDTLDRRMPVDLAMPVWWGDHRSWGQRLFNALDLPGLSLTVMNYRTDLDRLRAGAAPFFAWGDHSGIPVRIALETGSLGDELRVTYRAGDDSGELWLLALDDFQVLILLDEARSGLPGQAYAYRNELVFDADNLTFAGRPEQLDSTLDILEQEWSARPSFSGMAVHGFDEMHSSPSR